MNRIPSRLVQAARGEERRLGLLLAGAVAALLLGFVTVSPAMGEKLITAGGYYYLLGLLALFVHHAVRVADGRRGIWRPWLRRPGVVGIAILAASLLALGSDTFRHKILFDEYVLQATAQHMHATKEIGTVYRAYDIAGTWVPIDTFLDKRPYFFALLVSLLHDFTGYRLANIFLVNALLTPCFLGLAYWIVQAWAGRRAGLLALGLLATMPLLGQQSSGAGMELHNLTMLALVMALAILYLRVPGPDRLSALVLGTVLLAQCRYESVVFVFATAAVVVAGWQRAGRVFLTWPAVAAPLLLVPYVWQKRYVDGESLLWQLAEGQTSRFGWDYLSGNLDGAWHFFFNLGPGIANSAYLSILGVAGLLLVLGQGWRRARRTPGQPLSAPTVTVLAFGAGVAANLVLLMFYYWSRLDDVVASRFALPACLILALLAARLVSSLEAWWPSTSRLATLGLVIWTLGCAVPAMARRTYTNMNLVMQEVEWEQEKLEERRGPLLFVTNKSSIPFVLWRVPSVIGGVARLRGNQIQYHLRQGTFHEVIVAQALRPTTAEGDRGVDPDDLMPPGFKLETIAEKRFGGRWIRLSRLIAIEAPVVAVAEEAGPVRD